MAAKALSEVRPAVFINCPFDREYEEMLRAIVFTIAACGYQPRSALDDNDAGRIRFDKLTELIRTADLAVHDLSRIEVSEEMRMPRFNMPFELGLYLGAKHFGGKRQKQKRSLVLARVRREWAPTISDLAGIDPVFHQGESKMAMRAVRDFLHKNPSGRLLPGEKALHDTYCRFLSDIPSIARTAQHTLEEALRYRNYTTFLQEFLALQPMT